jgi:hypothetical protein
VRACAVEMHMDISQGHFYARIYGEKTADQMEHPDLTTAFDIYRKTPSVWTHYTVWGKSLGAHDVSHVGRDRSKGELAWKCWK